MPKSAQGSIFPAYTNQGIVFDQNGSNRSIQVPTQAMLTLFQKVAIKESDPTADALGLYSILNVGRDLKARFGSLSSLKHVFSNRKNGCAWNPKGSVSLGIEEIDTCAIEYNGEQCPDALYDDCFEMLFGGGNDVRDILGTPEGGVLFANLLREVNIGIGNSFSEIINFANHPDIATYNTSGEYAVSEDEWDDYYDQQMSISCGGIVTILDGLATAGASNYNYQIPSADIDANGDYTGDIIDLFKAVIAKADPKLLVMIRSGVMVNGARRFPIMKVTRQLYNAYKDYLLTTFSANPQTYRYQLMMNDGEILTMPDALEYEGMAVIPWDESESFDSILGSKKHRIAIFAPGNIGIAVNVPGIRMFEGIGLRMIQRLEAPYQGKIFMDTTLRVGTGLGDTALAVYGRSV